MSRRSDTAVIWLKLVTVTGTVIAPEGQTLAEPAVEMGAFCAAKKVGSRIISK